MLSTACRKESAMESHEMRLQGQMPGLLVENVLEMLQHSFFSENRLEYIVTTDDERSSEYSIDVESRRSR